MYRYRTAVLKHCNTDAGKGGRGEVGYISLRYTCVIKLLLKVKVVSTKKGSGHVLVMSSEEVRSFPLFRCEKALSCTQCVALQVSSRFCYSNTL